MSPENARETARIDHETKSRDPIENVTSQIGRAAAVIGEIEQNRICLENINNTDPDINDRILSPKAKHEKQELLYTIANLRLDGLYTEQASLPLNEFNQRIAETDTFFKETEETSDQNDSQFQWELMSKRLDLRALSVYRNAKESQTTLKGTSAEEDAWAIAETQMTGILRQTANLMCDMARYVSGNSREARKARGTLFETLIVGYARLQVYQNETFDKIFVRSALEREDKPFYPDLPDRGIYQHVPDHYSRRSFDVVVHNDDRQTDDLYQLKNNRNNTKLYDSRITKIEADHFGRITESLPVYVRDFLVLISNSSDPKMRDRINAAGDRLDSIFKPLINVS